MGRPFTDAVLQSVANLAAIGIERARTQETVARAEAARRSGELRATLFDAIAHDFKTPLTAAGVAAGALVASTNGRPDDHELAVILEEEVGRLQSVVSDAIQMLRIDAGDVIVHRERHAVVDLVRQAVGALGPRLDGHDLVIDVPDHLSVEADAGLVRLALRQILDNAVKYSTPTSRITISARTQGTTTMAIRNSGSSIPEGEHALILERFYRGSQAGRVPGSGLGLAIVKRIAEAHGGGVTIASSPGEGVTITLSLPPMSEALS
jgi:two-component system sensor histidine kinase KdpD